MSNNQHSRTRVLTTQLMESRLTSSSAARSMSGGSRGSKSLSDWVLTECNGLNEHSLMGFSIINHPFWGFSPYFWFNTHMVPATHNFIDILRNARPLLIDAVRWWSEPATQLHFWLCRGQLSFWRRPHPLRDKLAYLWINYYLPFNFNLTCNPKMEVWWRNDDGCM